MSSSKICGFHSVMEAVTANPRRLERVCIQRHKKDSRTRTVVDLARKQSIPVYFEDKSWLDAKADKGKHQGVIGFITSLETYDLEELLSRASSPGLLVVLDGIEDPQNLGAVLRSSEAAGVDGVILPARRSARLTPTAVRTSAGAAHHLPIARVPNTSNALDELKKNGYWVAGLHPGGETPLWKADYSDSTALVLGGEGKGLHRLVRTKCDFLVRIPIIGKVGSYNVGVAAGIVLYEVLRQRNRDLARE